HRPTPHPPLFPYTTLFRSRTAVAHDGPAVVRARLEDVDLVAAVGTVLVQPHVAGRGIHREAERTAMAERVNLRLRVRGFSDKRIDRKSTRLNSSHQIISYA